MVELIIEAYNEIPYAQNRLSIETSILLFHIFIAPLHKNARNSFVAYSIELY